MSQVASRDEEQSREAAPTRRGWPPVHPLLFAAYPVLSLYAANVRETTPAQALPPLLVAVLASAALLGLARPAFESFARAALVTSAAVVLFFGYDLVATQIRRTPLRGTGAVGVLFALAAIAAVVTARRMKRPQALTMVLDVVAFALVLTTLVPIVASIERVPAVPRPLLLTGRASGAAPVRPARDIYYLIFDRYAGAETLRRNFGYDNSAFLGALERLGFRVPRESRSNYPNTTLSLASSLNLSHLDPLLPDGATTSWTPARSLLRTTETARFLKTHGYRYVNIGSWFEPTRRNRLADANPAYDGLSEFSRVLLKSTVVQPLSRRIPAWRRLLDHHEAEYHRAGFQFRQVLEAGDRFSEPTFVFAHFLLPHEPYVFDREGRFVSRRAGARRPPRDRYVDQLVYANSRILEVVRRLLDVPEERRPIVILQSDEGPHPELLGPKPRAWNWSRATEAQLDGKFDILNAYYLPGSSAARVPDTITPVNTFRLIFNTYFGTRLPYLPDESYVFPDYQHLYDFEPVTQRVRDRRSD